MQKRPFMNGESRQGGAPEDIEKGRALDRVRSVDSVGVQELLFGREDAVHRFETGFERPQSLDFRVEPMAIVGKLSGVVVQSGDLFVRRHQDFGFKRIQELPGGEAITVPVRLQSRQFTGGLKARKPNRSKSFGKIHLARKPVVGKNDRYRQSREGHGFK